ncbi:hypothetical protein Sjap_001878 [Stephania japonica]|uniref:Protein MIZU-KUSSEI 1 n=1 Tax=Stephania japonica TaxID=461633 RepID=A0AAP0KMC9_9MAGN
MAPPILPSPEPHFPQPKSSATVSPERATTMTISIMASPTNQQITLQDPSHKKNNKAASKPKKLLRRFRSAFNSILLINQPCRMPASALHGGGHHVQGGATVTGTLFGHRRARVILAIQENPRCLPTLLLELAIPTSKLLQEMGSGLVRIALERDKCSSASACKLMEEPVWTMYCNGKKSGYAARREPSEEDLQTMQMLCAVSMGAGVLPSEKSDQMSAEGELAYVRAYFERIIGSKDSETFYMMNPDANSGPELSIFFVRI